jgi:hypothetical protein
MGVIGLIKPRKNNLIIIVILMGISLYLGSFGGCSSPGGCDLAYSYILPIIASPLLWFGLPTPIHAWIIVIVYWYFIGSIIAYVIEYFSKRSRTTAQANVPTPNTR